jgi:hypothetical protein
LLRKCHYTGRETKRPLLPVALIIVSLFGFNTQLCEDFSLLWIPEEKRPCPSVYELYLFPFSGSSFHKLCFLCYSLSITSPTKVISASFLLKLNCVGHVISSLVAAYLPFDRAAGSDYFHPYFALLFLCITNWLSYSSL